LCPRDVEVADGTAMATTTKDKIAKIRALVEPAITQASFELVDVELVSERGDVILRLYIDTIPPGTPERGVTVEHCADVSRLVGGLLDADETIDGNYHLEVSSPGLFRALTKPEHYDRVTGQRIKVKTYDKLNNRRMFTGTLARREDTQIVVNVDGVDFTIGLAQVAKANLEPEI
jgi:ribosome maturation factor RimP